MATSQTQGNGLGAHLRFDRRRLRRPPPPPGGGANFWGGVVYDIGTSPLYALREAVLRPAASGHGHAGGLRHLSLIIWALIVVVTIKYVLILLRADNNGEGGTLALIALAFQARGRRTPLHHHPARHHQRRACSTATLLITPAISVLSAVEGLKIATAA